MTRRILTLSLLAAALPLAGANVPRPALDLTVPLDNGKPVQLSSYKGKVTAVMFILTTCSHCQAASKALEKVYQAQKRRGFEVVAIAVDAGAGTKLGEFRKQYGVTFALGSDRPETMFTFMQLPLMTRPLMPQLAFLDRNGVIQSQYAGGDAFFGEKVMDANIQAEVAKLLGPVYGSGKKSAAKKK